MVIIYAGKQYSIHDRTNDTVCTESRVLLVLAKQNMIANQRGQGNHSKLGKFII